MSNLPEMKAPAGYIYRREKRDCDLHDSLYEMPYPDDYCSKAEKR